MNDSKVMQESNVIVKKMLSSGTQSRTVQGKKLVFRSMVSLPLASLLFFLVAEGKPSSVFCIFNYPLSTNDGQHLLPQNNTSRGKVQ